MNWPVTYNLHSDDGGGEPSSAGTVHGGLRSRRNQLSSAHLTRSPHRSLLSFSSENLAKSLQLAGRGRVSGWHEEALAIPCRDVRPSREGPHAISYFTRCSLPFNKPATGPAYESCAQMCRLAFGDGCRRASCHLHAPPRGPQILTFVEWSE
jgi:hypothetical protein